MSDKKFIYVTGKAYYTQVYKPNSYDRYSLDLVVDKVNAEKLKAAGLKPAITEEGQLKTYEGESGTVFRIKKNATKANGEIAKPIIVRDAYADPFDKLIGNGSKVEVCLTTYEGKLKSGKSYISSNLIGVQVIDLVPYEAPSLFTAKATKDITAEDVMEDVDEDTTFDSID